MIYGPYRTHASTPLRSQGPESVVPEVNYLETKRASTTGRRFTPPAFASPAYEFAQVAEALAKLGAST